MEEALTVRDAQQVAPADLFQIIAKVVEGPLDLQKVEVLERLLAMQERVMAQQREAAFADAMAKVHAKIPPIDKHGRIIVGGVERSRYAQLQDIHEVMRPILAEEGLSASFDEESYTDKHVTFVMKVWHRDGHFEIKRKTLTHDKAAIGVKGPIRNATQDDGSTAAYARRILYKMHFDIVEVDEDTDANDLECINEEQARDIETIIVDVGADKLRFLSYMGVQHISEILARDYTKAINALETKRKK